MSSKLFVNLPVKDLKKSMAFYKAFAFTFNPQYTDDTAACMVISEHSSTMLLTHEKFKGFVTKPIPDAHQTTGVLFVIAFDRKSAADEMSAKAIKAAGKEPKPKADYGFIVQRTIEDLDGHTWALRSRCSASGALGRLPSERLDVAASAGHNRRL